MKKALLLAALLAGSTCFAQTQSNTTFTYTTANQRNSFQKHWNLSDKEMERYEQVMVNEGRFRYPKLSPLEVLAITAPDEETMRYYAKKAAADEMQAVRAQLAYVVMVTEEKTKIYQELEAAAEQHAAAKEAKAAVDAETQAKINAYIAEHGGKDDAAASKTSPPAAADGKTVTPATGKGK
ncbi:hypothetical protein [Cardiobacterium valvarum]|nr:hypothetical protein [Cardiobacterium valvarum]